MKRTVPEPTILVTGGAGFVGSHLCERLLEAGHSVLAVDDLSTGDPSHIAHLLKSPRFRTARHDIARELPLEARIATRIFNLACPASPAYYQRHPVQTTLTSVLGTWRLLETAQRSGARLLQASTSEVYGDPEVHPQAESYHGHVNPIGPRSCYDEGKRCAEAMAFALSPRAGAADPGGAAVQQLRTAPDAWRRPRRQQLHRPGAARRAAHRLRRRPADAQLLLCRRYGRRIAAHDGEQHRGPGQHRQPGRAHGARSGRDRPTPHGQAARGSFIGRCPQTTRIGASPTSPWRETSSAGSRA